MKDTTKGRARVFFELNVLYMSIVHIRGHVFPGVKSRVEHACIVGGPRLCAHHPPDWSSCLAPGCCIPFDTWLRKIIAFIRFDNTAAEFDRNEREGGINNPTSIPAAVSAFRWPRPGCPAHPAPYSEETSAVPPVGSHTTTLPQHI